MARQDSGQPVDMTHRARKRSEGFMRIIHLSESKLAKLHAVADVL